LIDFQDDSRLILHLGQLSHYSARLHASAFSPVLRTEFCRGPSPYG